jgi:hypothetical protein
MSFVSIVTLMRKPAAAAGSSGCSVDAALLQNPQTTS